MIRVKMRGHQRRTMMKVARVNPMLIRKRMLMTMHQVTKKKKTVMMITTVPTSKEM
jgi:hypothetical protein